MSADDFMEATLDVWKINPESARRVQHPAPFRGVATAADRSLHLRRRRRPRSVPRVGIDTRRSGAHRSARIRFRSRSGVLRDRAGSARRRAPATEAPCGRGPRRGATLRDPDDDDDRLEFFQARATSEGKKAADIAERVLTDAGFTVVSDPVKIPKVGVQFNFLAEDAEGGRWYVDVSGRSRPCDPA